MSVNLRVALEEGAIMPQYAHAGDAGADVFALCPRDVYIQPRERALIDTGVRLDIPSGYEVQVRPRSGLALKHGITVLNAPGTVDSSYKGTVGVILYNAGDKIFTVYNGMKIAQLVVNELPSVSMFEVTKNEYELNNSSRGAGGFGSTGLTCGQPEQNAAMEMTSLFYQLNKAS